MTGPDEGTLREGKASPAEPDPAPPSEAVAPPRTAAGILRSRWPLLVALATCAFLALELRSELSIGRFDLNDHCYHYPIVARMSELLASGGNPIDAWFPEWTLGYAVPRTYQPLGHLVTALLHLPLGSSVDLLTFFIALRTLLYVLFPLTIYASVRIVRQPAPLAAACAVVAPFVSTAGLYGLELGSHAWRGSGLYTQLWAMHLLPLTLAVAFRAMRLGRRLWLASLLLALTFAAHLVYGYIGALSVVALALLPDEAIALPRRLVRLAAIGATSALASLWLLLPLVTDRAIINNSRWEDRWKFDSFGPARMLELLFGGDLLDYGRLPILTILAFLGLALAIRKWRAPEASFERFVVAGSVLWLALFAGRPYWGRLLDLVGLGVDVPLHRLIGGAHLFLMLAAGLGLWSLALLAGRHLPRHAAAALVVILFMPVLAERHDWCRLNASWGEQNRAACEREAADVDAVLAECASKEGRKYPGLAGTWGRDIKTGSVTLYSYFSMAGQPTVAFLYHAMALTADVMVRFDDSRPESFRTFGITSVAATDAQSLPPFLVERARFGRFRVLDAPGGGYFDVVDVAGAVACDRRRFHDVAWAWMQSAWPARLRYLALDLGASVPPDVPRFDLRTPLPPMGPAALGTVVEESREDQSYRARVEVEAPAWILFKMTFHPKWRIAVDGVPQPVVHVTPGLMAVRVEPGQHDVRCDFAPGPLRLLLLLVLAPLAILGLLTLERRLFVDRAEAAATASWIPPIEWIASRPRVLTPLVLVAVSLPLILPLLRGELTSGHDHTTYLPRLVEFHENIRQGVLLPRWGPDLGSGHGQPLFVFAPPLLMYVAELAHLAGLGLVWSMNLALAGVVLASTFGMYRFASFHLGREGGWVAAAAYAWAPYFCCDLYVRHAAAEFSAFAFYPLALDGISRIAASAGTGALSPGGARRHVVVAAVGIGGVLACSPPAALLFVPLACAFAAFEIVRRRSLAVAWRCAGALALGLAISATAWLPALAERQFVKMERLLEGYLRYSNHFVHLPQILSWKWGFGMSVLGPDDTMPFGMGPLHLLVGIAVVVTLVRRRAPLASLAVFLAVAVGAYAILMSTPSEPLWDRVQLLQYVEFPWRALAPAAACLAFLVGAAVPSAVEACRDGGCSPRRVATLLILAIVALNLPHAWPETSEVMNESDCAPEEIARRGLKVITVDEYEPKSVVAVQPYSPERAAIVAGAGEVRMTGSGPERLDLRVRADAPSMLELRTYSYPGWTISVDGEDVAHEVDAVSGFLRVALPTGEHDVLLELRRTPVQSAALGLAALGLAVALGLVAPWTRRNAAVPAAV